jgi:hypothetical protein
VTPCPAVTGPVTGGQICAQGPVHFDAVVVSGANEYKVNPWALVTTVTLLIVALFSATPDPAEPDADAEALDGGPLPALVLDGELEHAAALIATAATPAAASNLIRLALSCAPFSVPTVKQDIGFSSRFWPLAGGHRYGCCPCQVSLVGGYLPVIVVRGGSCSYPPLRSASGQSAGLLAS